MTFDEWINDAEPLILSNTYKEFHKRFGEAVWQAATLAERERCAKIAESYMVIPTLEGAAIANKIRGE